MVKTALGVEYDGAPYCGWQSQPSGCSVQDILQAALSAIAAGPIQVHAAGRTDSGVHAVSQVIHFETSADRPKTAWVRGVNAMLPRSVRVQWAAEVAADFHARFSARRRRYRYLIYNAPVASALLHAKAGWFHAPLEVSSMQRAAGILIGRHDFSSFRAAECQARSPVKELERLTVERRGKIVLLDFEADAFLHHMVRNIVGALVYVGAGRQPAEWVGKLLRARDRSLGAPTFDAAGLYLTGVDYPPRFALPAPADSEIFNALVATGVCGFVESRS